MLDGAATSILTCSHAACKCAEWHMQPYCAQSGTCSHTTCKRAEWHMQPYDVQACKVAHAAIQRASVQSGTCSHTAHKVPHAAIQRASVSSATCSHTACKVPHAAMLHASATCSDTSRQGLCGWNAFVQARDNIGALYSWQTMQDPNDGRTSGAEGLVLSRQCLLRVLLVPKPVLCRRLGLVQLQKAARSQLLQKDFGQHCPLGILLSCQPIPVGTELPWLMPGRWGNWLGPTGFVPVPGFQAETVTMGHCQQLQAALYLG